MGKPENPLSAAPRVVVLVDDRKRDLPLAALIAHHLDALGVECILEPLEAYRAVLAAYRPAMIVFNHLTASHLVAYSRRLAEMGVLTAVLPNEGIDYNEEQRRFNSGRHHSGAHIDHFFCWNQVNRDEMLQLGQWQDTRIDVVGVPRFDFYFEPWSRAFDAPRPRASGGKPKVLLCTNFQVARFWDLPKREADKFFAAWHHRIPDYKDYWKAVEEHHKASLRVFDFADALVASGKFDLTLRPHPREDVARYAKWAAALPPEQRGSVTLDATSNISRLILDTDLEISCETCTTALESWVAGKPTVELEFFKNPMFWSPEHAVANTPCEDPAALPGLVEGILTKGESAEVLAARQQHLQKWCHGPDGRSSQRVAAIIAEAVQAARPVDWQGLRAEDTRRATKLKLLRNLNLAYHFDPLMPVKLRMNRGRYAIKNYAYQKSIKPRDVADARQRVSRVAEG
jgi:surface carbohydrate biosynthesis protein